MVDEIKQDGDLPGLLSLLYMWLDSESLATAVMTRTQRVTWSLVSESRDLGAYLVSNRYVTLISLFTGHVTWALNW